MEYEVIHWTILGTMLIAFGFAEYFMGQQHHLNHDAPERAPLLSDDQDD
jgi:hypothetical protein